MLGYKVGDEFSKLRGRKGNGRRGKNTMERGMGKGSRIIAYLISQMTPMEENAYLPQRRLGTRASQPNNLHPKCFLC